jgi:hypothetical protein
VNARRPGRGHEWSPCAEQPLPACAFLAVAALTAAVACTGDRTPSAVVRSGGLTFEASLDPERARLKDNNVEVRLLDDDGSPIEGAQIDAVALMPAMGAMPEMRSRAEVAEVGNGRYRAELDVAMAGTWVLTVDARMPGGGGGTAKYSFTVGKPGLVSLDGGAAERQVPSSDHGEHAVVSPRGEAGGSGVVRIDPRRWQTIGVRTGVVERRPLRLEIRAVGKVVYDETRLSEISVKYAGWIGELEVDTTGQAVRRGQTLFTLYSPELYAAQQELLTAVASQHSARATSAPDRADYLVEASRQRLRLWDLDDAQIDRIVASGEPTQYLPIRSTATGVVIEKRVVAGAAVQPGMPLYRIAGLDRVWVEAEVYESDLALVEVGQEAEIRSTRSPTSPTSQVIVFTEWPEWGPSPDLVEDQITYPLATSLLAAPRVRYVRGQSMFGHVLRLRDLRGRHRHLLGALARARVPERGAQGRLPDGVTRRSARRHRRRLGLPVRARRRERDASTCSSCAASRTGTCATRSRASRRRRGRLGRRLRQGSTRSSSTR